jgi:hypothetical protein
MTAPEPTMHIGDRVAWVPDGEPGVIVALNESAIAVHWTESGIEWYSLSSGANRAHPAFYATFHLPIQALEMQLGR